MSITAQIIDSIDRANVLFEFGQIMRTEAELLGEPTWDTSPTGLVEGTRQIVLPLREEGHTAEASMSVLSELLTRTSRLYLQWQTRVGSEPVWFELVPSTAGGALDFTRVYSEAADSSWQWKVTLTAKAFALGARETLTPTSDLVQAGLIVNNPIEIPDQIKGSAPAPLNLDVGAGNLSGWRAQLSSWAMDSAMTLFPWMVGAASWTTTESGASQLASAQVMPGQYRGMVYVERLTGTGSCRVQVGVRNNVDGHFGSATVPQYTWATGRAVTPKGNDIGYWVDTGRLNLPYGVDPSRLPEGALGSANFFVNVTTDGSGTQWKLSRLMLMPVQTPMSRVMTTSLAAAWGHYPDTGGFMRVDGENRSIGCVYDDDSYQLIPAPVVDGGFPMVFPGARNFLMFIPRVNDVETAYRYGGFGDQAPTTMWYYPRYLHVGAR